MKCTTFVLGDIYTNTYLLEDESTSYLAVVDPACKSEKLIDAVKERGGKLKYILLTHGHFDHIGGVKALVDEFSPEVYAGIDEIRLIENPQLNGSAWHNLHIDEFEIDRKLEDEDTFMLGNTQFKFITTPGHTRGSGCYIADDCIFSGDTLFYRSIGRTDFPTSSMSDMNLSMLKLSSLEGDYAVYPGHDISTKLSDERKYNPFMR
ncbi:MAG: MBL fold metallo-hydrolase [Ruminococcus sp.]|nr:MBL fold metallo-hydrolase [Ruminococcus sp.]